MRSKIGLRGRLLLNLRFSLQLSYTGLPLKYWAPTYGELNLYLRSPYGQNSKYTYVLPTASSIYTYVLPTPHQNKLKSPINPFIRRDIPTTYLLSCNLRRVKSTYRRGKYLRVATLETELLESWKYNSYSRDIIIGIFGE